MVLLWGVVGLGFNNVLIINMLLSLLYSLLHGISVPHNTDYGYDEDAQQAASNNQSYVKRRQCLCALGA